MASSELKFPFCALKFLQILSQARKQCLGDEGRHWVYFEVRDTSLMENKKPPRLCLQSIADSWVSWSLMCWKLELFFSLFFLKMTLEIVINSGTYEFYVVITLQGMRQAGLQDSWNHVAGCLLTGFTCCGASAWPQALGCWLQTRWLQH